MPTVNVTWVGARQFVGTDSNGHSIVLSGDDPATGVRPSEMLLVALAACSGYDVVQIMEKKRYALDAFEVVVDGERDPRPPWAYHTIRVTYRLRGPHLTEKAVAQAIDLSVNKYCSVAATVGGKAKIETAFEILDAKG
jgi:putative redox protein